MNLSRTAILAIDLQNEYRQDATWPVVDYDAVLANAEAMMRTARRAGDGGSAQGAVGCGPPRLDLHPAVRRAEVTRGDDPVDQAHSAASGRRSD